MARSKTRRYTKRRGFRKRRGTKRRNRIQSIKRSKRQYGGRDPTPRVTSDNPNDFNEEEAILERQMRIIT